MSHCYSAARDANGQMHGGMPYLAQPQHDYPPLFYANKMLRTIALRYQDFEGQPRLGDIANVSARCVRY